MRICAIVPAAGRSQRMGRQKALLPLAGQTMIGHIVDQVRGGGVDELIVVVRGGDAAVARALAGRAVRIVANPDPEADMLSSVRVGLSAMGSDFAAVAVALGDQPGIRGQVLREMIEAFRAGRGRIVVPVHKGQRGHPLLFAAEYVGEILSSFEGEGLRGLLRAHPQDVWELEVPDASVLVDIDRPEDYQRELRARREVGP